MSLDYAGLHQLIRVQAFGQPTLLTLRQHNRRAASLLNLSYRSIFCGGAEEAEVLPRRIRQVVVAVA
jgi:hypothetical protein